MDAGELQQVAEICSELLQHFLDQALGVSPHVLIVNTVTGGDDLSKETKIIEIIRTENLCSPFITKLTY